jgi:hypothetical protein
MLAPRYPYTKSTQTTTALFPVDQVGVMIAIAVLVVSAGTFMTATSWSSESSTSLRHSKENPKEVGQTKVKIRKTIGTIRDGKQFWSL